MSDHLERILKQFLKVLRCECCIASAQIKYKSAEHRKQFKDWADACLGRYLCLSNGGCTARILGERATKQAPEMMTKAMTEMGIKYENDVRTDDAMHALEAQHFDDRMELWRARANCKQLTGKEPYPEEKDKNGDFIGIDWDGAPLYNRDSQPDMKGTIQKFVETKQKRKIAMIDLKKRINKAVKKLPKSEQDERETAEKQLKVKISRKHRIAEILMDKFHEFRKDEKRVRFDRISPQLLRFFTHDEDVEEKVEDENGKLTPKQIPRTISFQEIMMVYPNAHTVTFVNRHLDHEGHNTSCLNGLVIESLLYEVRRERKGDEPKESPLKKVVFTYYDYEGDIFDANEKLKNTEIDSKMKRYFDAEYLKTAKIAGWKVKHHKIGSGYKIRIERDPNYRVTPNVNKKRWISRSNREHKTQPTASIMPHQDMQNCYDIIEGNVEKQNSWHAVVASIRNQYPLSNQSPASFWTHLKDVYDRNVQTRNGNESHNNIYTINIHGIHQSAPKMTADASFVMDEDSKTTEEWLVSDTSTDIDNDHKTESEIQSMTGKAAYFRAEIQDKLMDEMMDYDDKIQPKTTSDLSMEAANGDCCNAPNGNEHTFDLVREQCPCFKRIHIVMEAYYKLLRDDVLWETVSISEVIQSDQYGHQQLTDDFLHILHFHKNAENGQRTVIQQMVLYFKEQYPCVATSNVTECKGHRRRFTRDWKGARIGSNIYDDTFRWYCDMIHSFFFQFSTSHFSFSCLWL